MKNVDVNMVDVSGEGWQFCDSVATDIKHNQ